MNKIYTNSQIGGTDELFKGERLENFRKKYEYFTKTLNIIRNENKITITSFRPENITFKSNVISPIMTITT